MEIVERSISIFMHKIERSSLVELYDLLYRHTTTDAEDRLA